MGPVVDPGHDEAEDQQDDGQALRLLGHVAAAAAAPVVEQGAEEAEDRGGGPDGEPGPTQERGQERQEGPGHAAGEEAGQGGRDVDDHGPCRSVHLRGPGRQVPHPVHVEEDVKDSAVKPGRAEDCPPPAEAEDRHRPARPEEEEALDARGEEGQHAAGADTLEIRGQAGEIERPADPHDQLGEAQVVAEVPENVGEAPHPRVAPAAVETLRVLDPDEGAARGAEGGAGSRHGPSILPARRGVTLVGYNSLT